MAENQEDKIDPVAIEPDKNDVVDLSMEKKPFDPLPPDVKTRLEDIWGNLPRVTSAPSWNPRKFNEELVIDETSNRLYFYDFASQAWQWVESPSAYVDGGSQASAVTFNLSQGNKHQVTLAGTVTISLSNVKVGQVFLVRLIQDGTGSRTVSWFSTIKWAGGSAPTLTTTAGKIDVLGFVCVSSGNYDGFVVGQNL